MNSTTLVVLDYVTTNVLFIPLNEEITNKIEEEYENDTESWISDSGLEEKFGFSVSNSNWMLCDDGEVEMFRCNPENGEKTQVFHFM